MMKYTFNQLLSEYSEKNIENVYEPVAVGKYGIRKRSEIYKKELADDYSNNKLIYNNTLTIGLGSKQIDFGVLTEDFIYSVSPAYKTFYINNEIIESRYLELYLVAANEYLTKKYMIASARQGKKVDIENMFKETITIPDVSEQRRIVNDIMLIRDSIEKDYRLIDLLDEMVDSVFFKMFGDPLHPKKSKPLGVVAQLERGKFTPRPRNDPKYFDGAYPFIQTGDISASDHRLSEYKQTLNDLGCKVSKEFCRGTIVMAIVGATIGSTAILERDVYAPDSIIGITPHEYNNIFLEKLLSFWREKLLADAPESARPNINLKILDKIPIIDVDVKLQEEFVNLLNNVIETKDLIKKRMIFTDELLSKKMYEYFIA